MEKENLTFDRILGEGLTFDDVLLIPFYSEVLPREVDRPSPLPARVAWESSTKT